MTYNTLNTNGKGLNELAQIKIKDAKLKIKVARAMRWYKEEVEDLQQGIDVISENYDLVNQFNKDGVWQGTEEEKTEFLNDSKEKAKEIKGLMKTDLNNEPKQLFDLDDLSEVKELSPDAMSDLMILNLIEGD